MSYPSINQTPKMSAEPLAEFLKTRFPGKRPEAVYDNAELEKHGLSQYIYGRRDALTVTTADKIACRLTMHPWEIWPEWFTVPCQEDLEMHGLTRQELADAIGVTIGTIHSWKRSGVYSNVNEWIAECLSPTCVPA